MTVELRRRDVLGMALVGIASPAPAAQRGAGAPSPANPVPVAAPPEPAGLLSREVVELWPAGRIPGADGVAARRIVLERGANRHDRAVTHVGRPILEVFRPARPNGAAMLVLPGGGYRRLAIDKEGAGGARYLAAKGVTAFVLNYRLPGDGWAAGYDAALQDVQRGIRLVRSRATSWRIDPARLGVMGFSAGGHLAAAALTRFDDQTYAAVDAADAGSARPDMAVLGYAVMQVDERDQPGVHANAAAARPLDRRVRAGLAPTFVFHAADDRTVPVANSLSMFAALKDADVPSELHVYAEGGHGFGFSLPTDRPASRWPEDWLAWARRSGFLGS